jgi:hypothetical protein
VLHPATMAPAMHQRIPIAIRNTRCPGIDGLGDLFLGPRTWSARRHRCAHEWARIRLNGESDPNRDDDPDYIVRLVGQVVRVSVETVRIVKGLPDYR